MSNIEKRIEKNIFLTKFGTYQVRKFERLGYKVKSFKTLEEARARRKEIEESIKDRKKGDFAYPDTLFDELFKDKSKIDDVLNFYKRSGNVKCKFSTPSIVNIDELVKRVATQLEYGLISKPEALKIVNPDLDERQSDGMKTATEIDADTLFDELFKDKSKIDIDYVYNHFDENLKYIFQNDKHCLNEREVEMFCLYYISGYTLEAIGNIYGITRERVRQIISKSKRKINHSATINYLRYGYEVQQNQDDIEKIKEQIQIEKKRLIEELRQPTITEEDLINFNKNMLIDELDLSVRGYNSLVRAGIRTVGDLTNLTDNDLWAVRNLGRRAHAEIIETLKERGFSLKEEE